MASVTAAVDNASTALPAKQKWAKVGVGISSDLALRTISDQCHGTDPRFRLTKGVVANAVQAVRRLHQKNRLPAQQQTSAAASSAGDAKEATEQSHPGPVVPVAQLSAQDLTMIVDSVSVLLQRLCVLDPLPHEIAMCLWKDGVQLLRLANEVGTAGRKVLFKEPYKLGATDNTVPSDAFQKELNEFRQKHSREWLSQEKDPFAEMKFSTSVETLHKVAKSNCPQCNRRVHLYCPNCVVPVAEPLVSSKRPALPLSIELVHHPQEKRTKSTGIHACALFEEAHLHTFSADAELKFDPATTVLLYPDEAAVDLEEVDLSSVRSVVVIEATWNKGPVVARHPALAALRHVRFRTFQTTYWRTQEHGNAYLATIEAIYHFCVVYFEALHKRRYAGEFDDMMLIYALWHRRVMLSAKEENHVPKNWRPDMEFEPTPVSAGAGAGADSDEKPASTKRRKTDSTAAAAANSNSKAI